VDLRKRLARMDTLSRRHQPEAEFAAPGDGDPEAVREQLGLQVVSSPAGDVWQREDLRRDVPLPAGPVPDLSGFLPAGTPRGLRWQDVLFLDTETTGLSGGTGTLVFLMGLAWWDDDGAFRVRQMFLPGPGREGAMLQGVADLAADRQVVATYNGASFDLPLVRTRARLNRRPDPVAELVSWDLLVAARRSWGRALENCRQQTVETAVCGRERGVGDIDGALIPATYQRFLHASELGDLPQVLRHNRRDMDGLGLVLAALADEAAALQRPPAGDEPWCCAWSRALLGERRRCGETAAAWARGVDETAASDRAVLDAIRQLKRVADWEAVTRLVTVGLERWPDHQRLHYEAAVLFEHRLGDPARALVHARALGDDHRLTRLAAKLATSS